MQSNLLKRVITASIIFPLVISIILYQNDLIVRLFLNIVIFLAAFELSRLCFTDNSENRKRFIFITIVFISIFLSNLIVKNNIWSFQIIFSIILWLAIFLYIFKLERVFIMKVILEFYMHSILQFFLVVCIPQYILFTFYLRIS